MTEYSLNKPTAEEISKRKQTIEGMFNGKAISLEMIAEEIQSRTDFDIRTLKQYRTTYRNIQKLKDTIVKKLCPD